MSELVSRRNFLSIAGAATAFSLPSALLGSGAAQVPSSGPTTTGNPFQPSGRIVDMHVHFRPQEANFLDVYLKLADRLNMAACILTPFAHRNTVAEAAKSHPNRIIPFGSLRLDAPDAVQQVQEFHSLGFRGLGEIEGMQKNCNDPSYFPVYELASQCKMILMFHTGIMGRGRFDRPSNAASGRMHPMYLDEIARQFPQVWVLGAHLGNPAYEWAGEVTRWNPNVYFDLSGTTLDKMHDHLGDFRRIFWWKDVEWEAQATDDPSPYSKLVFGTDCGTPKIETVVNQYHAMFEACDVPERTRKMIMGGTMERLLGLTS